MTKHYVFEVTEEAAELIADALAIVQPDSEHAENLARNLETYFRYCRITARKK
jgi:hypothetical protein